MRTPSLRVVIILACLLSLRSLYAENEKEVSLLPTVKAPLLLHVGAEANAQYMVKNHSENTITLALMPQKGVRQDSSGLLACPDSFTLKPGQKCLLNLIIKGEEVGQKIAYGPLVCKAEQSGHIKPSPLFCAQPTPRDSLNITFTRAEIAVIEADPQTLSLHAASATPVQLQVTNHSDTVTAKHIKAELPDDWEDVRQNAKDCAAVKPGQSCLIYFIAQKARPATKVIVAGSNTTKIPIKIMIRAHDLKILGPATDINDVKL